MKFHYFADNVQRLKEGLGMQEGPKGSHFMNICNVIGEFCFVTAAQFSAASPYYVVSSIAMIVL
jgi:hypothetical protein